MSTQHVSSTSGTASDLASSYLTSSLTTTATTASTVGQGSIESSALKVYLAGGLFDAHQLHGNANLARAIETQAKGRYIVDLPQDMPFDHKPSPYELRDGCLKHVIAADCVVVQFNGTELDSGTVVEFDHAKKGDIPTVAVRTDFRAAGDQGPEEDPWNLMVSHYPRTAVRSLNSMELYQTNLQKHRQESLDTNPVAHACLASLEVLDQTATAIISGLDEAVKTPPLMKREDQKTIYTWLAVSANFQQGPQAATSFFLECLARKQRLNLL